MKQLFYLLISLLIAGPALADNLNLALGKQVYASSIQSNNASFAASKAVDGDHVTRWSSAYADPQWIYVDLGANQRVDRVRLSWEAAYGKDFTLDVSDDASTWTTVLTITGNNPPAGNNGQLVNEYTNLGASGRYVRLYGTARGTTFGYSLYELEVFGYSNPAASLATGKAGQASDTQNNFNASLAFDGSFNSRWSTTNATNQWVYVDLRGVGTLSRLYLNWEKAWGIDYLIQTSNDLATWTTVATVTNNQAYYNELSLPSGTTGRYVRLFGQTGGQNNGGFSVWEMQVYGTLTPLPVQLVSFTVQRQSTEVALTWATATELNNRGYEVQRSADGQLFETLGFVSGAGNSASTRRYQYLDQSTLPGLSYYRLRQVDTDGRFTYSPVRVLAAPADAAPATCRVYPNPASGQATLSWQACTAGTASWTLVDALGRVTQGEQFQTQAGANAVRLPLPSGAPGLYVLLLDSPGQSSQRLRVQVQ